MYVLVHMQDDVCDMGVISIQRQLRWIVKLYKLIACSRIWKVLTFSN